MAGADTSLWPVVVGGLLGVGGTLVGVIGTTIRDVALQRHEKTKRRADKFEELVAAVYEFDHWLEGISRRSVFGRDDIPQTVSPLAKLQSTSATYFPQFDGSIRELHEAAGQYRIWMYQAGRRGLPRTLPRSTMGSTKHTSPMCRTAKHYSTPSRRSPIASFNEAAGGAN